MQDTCAKKKFQVFGVQACCEVVQTKKITLPFVGNVLLRQMLRFSNNYWLKQKDYSIRPKPLGDSVVKKENVLRPNQREIELKAEKANLY